MNNSTITRLSKLRGAAAAVGVLATVALAGCATGSASPETNERRPEQVQAFEVKLDDGRSVLCVWAKSGYGGGLSCDWARAVTD
ncbi:hypothetical protein [Microbacterium gilvum]|uniref:DUF333 domain-containing protein n=1 Tax=Microbacterium gilvum TaxID=1336204 RepID=A0ABP8ZPI0_9MICO